MNESGANRRSRTPQLLNQLPRVLAFVGKLLRPLQPAAAVGLHVVLDEAAEGRDPSKSHSRVSTARAAGVDAVKGAVARA